ncbi:MAG: hypothetical protein PHC61_00720, partial [Chitinivibrionales bacterium]|nr:hypothetical protein [Chitinivibrionales bacterium]
MKIAIDNQTNLTKEGLEVKKRNDCVGGVVYRVMFEIIIICLLVIQTNAQTVKNVEVGKASKIYRSINYVAIGDETSGSPCSLKVNLYTKSGNLQAQVVRQGRLYYVSIANDGWFIITSSGDEDDQMRATCYDVQGRLQWTRTYFGICTYFIISPNGKYAMTTLGLPSFILLSGKTGSQIISKVLI